MFGHILLFPKKHVKSMEELEEKVASHLFRIANKLSSIAFQGLGMHGTNIIVQDGLAAGQRDEHLCLHIIPRKQGDGLNFEWQPKKLTDEEMSVIELKLKGTTKSVGILQKEKPKPINLDKETEKIEDTTDDNYLIRQLRHIP